MCSTSEPSLLQDLCIRSLKETYGRYLINLLECVNKLQIIRSLQDLRETILDKVPCGLVDKVFTALKEVISEKCMVINTELEYYYYVLLLKNEQYILPKNGSFILSELMKTVIRNLKIKILCVDTDMRGITGPVLQYLFEMPQLRELDVNFHVNEGNESLFVESLKCLPNLVKLSCDYCTDDVLSAISKNCLKLESVNLHLKTFLSESILGLAMCKNIKCLFLMYCKAAKVYYPVGAIAFLMSSLPNLEEIGIYDVSKVLDALAIQNKQCPALKIVKNCIKFDNLRTLNAFCPQLQEVHVCVEKSVDLHVNNTFRCLSNLKVFNLDFTNPNLPLFLQKAPNLRSLELSDPQTITGNGLRILAEHCPKLTTLVLSFVFGMPVRGLGNIEMVELPVLEVLEIRECNLPDIFFQVRCPNLKCISVYYYDGVNTELVEEFIALNSKTVIRRNIKHDGLARLVSFECLIEKV